ncbi:hypothetical protein GCM10022403_063390 [Streptomyces coacervatus]|uniref:HTH arsR-type domain-containing protein n=1 Tax=Streptomyces coacervatus TaxID=647381 RepID=A0ABP7ILH1_9ACTN|nr:ArsR family transcriptional regulator [Streptomyces coacervatus]MDF2268855.1 helix-turn-helix domain-containing protein [Streptomyces coacervatus]
MGWQLRQTAVRELQARRDLPLLTAIRSEPENHVPGFLFSQSAAQDSLEAELQAVASTPGEVVARQLEGFPESRRIRTFLAAGERSFAQRAALELGRFWSEFMADRWNSVRSRIEEDIRHRSASLARRGLSATLNSLHPAFSYDSGVLSIRDERTWSLVESRRIVLHPSPLVTTWMVQDDPWGESGTHLAYPVGADLSADRPEEQPPLTAQLGQVIGEARQLLLADLGDSRTTTELAERHHMSASTVSYHLLRLHRVGLLHRTREGSRVYYRRTPEADRLVARRDRRTAGRAGGAGMPPARDRQPTCA